MTTQEAAARYLELASQRKFIEIQNTLYHEGVVCQEPDKATAMGMLIFFTKKVQHSNI
jgi:SnoaL-like protein